MNEKVLSKADCLVLILWFERHYQQQNPFDSVYKLYKFAKKVKGILYVWVLSCIKDQLETKKMGPKDFPDKVLTGSGTGGGKGLIDLYVLKREMCFPPAIETHGCTSFTRSAPY